MNHLGTKNIETHRLLLRKFVMSDSSLAFKNWTNDEEVTKYLTWPAHGNVKVTESVFQDWIEQSKKTNFYQWAIVLKDINEPIGSIGAVKINDDLEIVTIGYCIGRNWWHTGIVSEALQAILSFFFEEVHVNRVEATHDINNPNSGKVMMKCGMSYEGTLRQASRNNTGIADICMYSLLREEWEDEYANRQIETQEANKYKVKLEDVLLALESADDESNYYFKPSTQTIEVAYDFDSEFYDEDEEEDEDEFDFIRLPSKFDINEYGIMVDFIYCQNDSTIAQTLNNAIRGRGAFRRFKNQIRNLGIENDWYAYRDERYKQIAIEWCEENDIIYY